MGETSTPRNGWSLQIGRVFDIPIRVHFTFLLLLLWFGVRSAREGDDLTLAILFLLAVFGCVLLHELGHSLMARRFGVKTRDIVLYPIGGIARLENIPGGKAELLIAAAGPAVNMVLVAAGAALLAISPLSLRLTGQLDSASEVATRLILANGMLFAFNLIPAFPMDGGRMLRSGLSLVISPARATAIATTVGQGIAILFGVASFTIWRSPVLMLIALFVFLGASQEAFAFRQRSAVAGRTAREAMITRLETLAPQDSLEQAALRLIDTNQQDFPVVDAWNRVVGILSRKRLLEGLARDGGSSAVLDVMERGVTRVDPSADLDIVLRFLRARPGCPLIVMDGDRLVGMITLENLTRFIEVTRRAELAPGAAPSGGTAPPPASEPTVEDDPAGRS